MKKTFILGIIALFLITTVACSNKKIPVAAENPNQVNQKQTVDSFGTIKATEIKNIVIDFNATVEKVNVKEGQKVVKDQPLAVLNTSEYESQIKSKEVELTSVRNEINRLLPKAEANPDVDKLLNDAKAADSVYNKALSDLAVKEELVNAGSLSQNELDEFKKYVDLKQKDKEDIQFALESAKVSKQKDLDQKQTESNQNKTKADLLNFEIKIMKEKLSKSYLKHNQIVSDIPNSLIYNIGYVSGDITNSSKSFLSIINLDKLVAEANINEEFIKEVKIGSTATITPLADKSKTYKGKVIYISDKAVTNNGETTIPVQLSIDDKDDFLMPDFNIDVKIDIQK